MDKIETICKLLKKQEQNCIIIGFSNKQKQEAYININKMLIDAAAIKKKRLADLNYIFYYIDNNVNNLYYKSTDDGKSTDLVPDSATEITKNADRVCNIINKEDSNLFMYNVLNTVIAGNVFMDVNFHFDNVIIDPGYNGRKNLIFCFINNTVGKELYFTTKETALSTGLIDVNGNPVTPGSPRVQATAELIPTPESQALPETQETLSKQEATQSGGSKCGFTHNHLIIICCVILLILFLIIYMKPFIQKIVKKNKLFKNIEYIRYN